MKYPTLETERLFLRRPTAADRTEMMRHLGASPRASATAPLAGGVAWAQSAAILAGWDSHGHGLFAILPQGAERPIGLAGPWMPSGWPEPEIGWLIWADDACQSLGREAVHAACRYAAMHLGWTDPASFVESDAAAALAQSLGCLDDPFALTRDGAQVFRHPPLRPRMPRAA